MPQAHNLAYRLIAICLSFALELYQIPKMEPALAMMMEVLKNATFKPSSIQLALSNTQVGQKQLQENPSKLMDIRFYRALYGQHPYAEPITGTIGSTKNYG